MQTSVNAIITKWKRPEHGWWSVWASLDGTMYPKESMPGGVVTSKVAQTGLPPGLMVQTHVLNWYNCM